MSDSVLVAEPREVTGKSASGKIRRDGKVPCILYGIGSEAQSLTVNKRELDKILHESHSVINVEIDKNIQNAVIKEIQYHPVKGDVIHVDFLKLQTGHKLTVDLPLKFVGTSVGVKAGGIFQELKSHLSVTCLPKDLIDQIEVDITNLEIGDAIHVKDLYFENFEFEDQEDVTICSVIHPSKREEVEETGEEEEEGEEEATEPEVITAKKTEDEE